MSRPLTGLKAQIIEHLGGLADFGQAAVVSAYPEKQRSFPLKKPVVTVEIGGLNLAPSGFGSYLGGDTPIYGAAATISLRFGIYCEAAEECGSLFESLCGALLDVPELGAISISCDKLAYDVKTASYLLYAAAEIKAAWIFEKPEERRFTDIELSKSKEVT